MTATTTIAATVASRATAGIERSDRAHDPVAREQEADEEDRDAEPECRAAGARERVLRVGQHLLRADREEHDAEHDRVVADREHVPREWAALARCGLLERALDGARDEPEVGEPQRRDAGEGDRDGECEHRVAREGSDARTDGDNRLAQRDDHDQRIALGEVRRRDTPVVLHPRGEHADEIDDDREGPERGAERQAVDEAAREHECGGDEEERNEPPQGRELGRAIAQPPGVEDQVEDADEEVRAGEPGTLVPVGARHGERHEQRSRHAGEEEERRDLAIDLDGVRHPREARPGPPHECEDERRPGEAGDARVREQQQRHLGDREDEDEVEEELEVARPPLLLVGADLVSRGNLARDRGRCHGHAESNRYANGPRPCR